MPTKPVLLSRILSHAILSDKKQRRFLWVSAFRITRMSFRFRFLRSDGHPSSCRWRSRASSSRTRTTGRGTSRCHGSSRVLPRFQYPCLFVPACFIQHLFPAAPSALPTAREVQNPDGHPRPCRWRSRASSPRTCATGRGTSRRHGGSRG